MPSPSAHKWPKTLPPLTSEQRRISDDFMKLWHEVLPQRFGIVETFNHNFPVKYSRPGFRTTLEIGAGLGEHLHYEKLTPEQEKEYYALELRENMAAEIRKSFPRVQATVGDCQARLNFPDGAFDRVIAVHVLEHLPNLPACIRESWRLLNKQSGQFLVVIPTEGSPAYTLARKISAERVYKKRYGGDYSWFYKREHINLAPEILEELDPYFTIEHKVCFPLPFLPMIFCNLCIGLALRPRPLVAARDEVDVPAFAPVPRVRLMQRVFITGAAGFIGSSLADRLLAENIAVVGWDNFSTGQRHFLEGATKNPRFSLVQGDNLDLPALTAAMKGCDLVVHLAANADVRFGTEHPRRDLEQNTSATFNVLEAMRANGIKRIAFSSTGSVYGEAAIIPTPEDAPFPVQTSLYGASKVACEGLIAAYGEGFGFECYIFRFVSILGERYTHGHIFDFYQQLIEHPGWLKILGNGQQRKSYLYVQDCLDAILHVVRLGTALKAPHRTQVYNLGTSEYVQVNDSVRFICNALGLKPELRYTGGDRGWIGDNPFIFLDTNKIQSTGWKPKLTIEQGIVKTLRWLEANRWIYDLRGKTH